MLMLKYYKRKKMVSLNQILGFCESLKFKVVLVGCRPLKVTRKKGWKQGVQRVVKYWSKKHPKNLRGIILRWMILWRMILRGMILRGMILRGIILQGMIFRGMILLGIIWEVLQDILLQKILLQKILQEILQSIKYHTRAIITRSWLETALEY